ncbi:hypothetical protein K1F50_19480 [Muricauda oceani]|uniref:Lipocalin-like domain-containing protein n=1 Tax=Flagellimonas oceani TaxID=2698672 RepID=A0A6G7J7M7_9FLAO|nr:hypothetical protein [Allomuricauda oceani]MBW8244995.1 hypothetical protein [Allomuricauda oceani]QII46442.1 hypothetical protein GVT53_17715 [Allomuricauda oceani]
MKKEFLFRLILGASMVMYCYSYAQENDIDSDFLVNEWVISSLESSKEQIVFRNKDDFFVKNDFVRPSGVIKLSKKEGNIYSAAKYNIKSFGRCGNDLRSKTVSSASESWTLNKDGNYYFITITKQRTYTDNSFTKIKRKYLLEYLQRDKMILTVVNEAIN